MAGAPLVREDSEIWMYYNALRMPGSDVGLLSELNPSSAALIASTGSST